MSKAFGQATLKKWDKMLLNVVVREVDEWGGGGVGVIETSRCHIFGDTLSGNRSKWVLVFPLEGSRDCGRCLMKTLKM